MNEKDCTLLVMLEKKRNMTVVAKSMFISQPALSYRLQQIETNFNTQIFTREQSGLVPTAQGELIIKYARNNLRQLESMAEKVEHMVEKVSGTIKLGVASTYGQYILPDILNRFLKMYPDVNFKITTGLSSKIFNMFENGDIHIGILRGDFKWEEEKELLTTESICIVSKNPIALKELPDIQRIEYKMDDYLKNIVDNWWKDIFKIKGLVSMTVDNLETAKELVRTGIGYVVLPGICLTGEKELSIQPIKNDKNKTIKRFTWAYCRDETLDFLAVKEFYKFLQVNRDIG